MSADTTTTTPYAPGVRGEPVTPPTFENPCLPDGTTLWGVQDCTPTTTIVEVGTPPTLPPTGTEMVHDVAFGGGMIVAALLLAAVSHRRAAR